MSKGIPSHLQEVAGLTKVLGEGDLTNDLGADGQGLSLNEGARHTITDPVEMQAHLMPFEDTFNDFCDRVIQFGYIVLFAPAFSLAPSLAFINNVIEIRTAGFRFCSAFRRPVAEQQGGIGSWLGVLNILGFLAVLTNASMITFVGSQDAERTGLVTTGFLDRTKYWNLWLTFVSVEHAVLALRVLIMTVLPDTPAWISEAQSILDYRCKVRYKTQTGLALDKIEIERIEKAQQEYESMMDSSYAQLRRKLVGQTIQDLEEMFHKYDTDASERYIYRASPNFRSLAQCFEWESLSPSKA